MNDRDRKNLDFLLYSDQDIIKIWYDEVSEDDRLYASELMDVYSDQLFIQKNYQFDINELLNKFRLDKE